MKKTESNAQLFQKKTARYLTWADQHAQLADSTDPQVWSRMKVHIRRSEGWASVDGNCDWTWGDFNKMAYEEDWNNILSKYTNI